MIWPDQDYEFDEFEFALFQKFPPKVLWREITAQCTPVLSNAMQHSEYMDMYLYMYMYCTWYMPCTPCTRYSEYSTQYTV